MESLFESFTLSVMKLNKLVNKIKLYEMEDYGLQAVHVMCLFYIARGGVTMSELVRLTYEDKAAISRAVSLLTKKGYASYDSSKYNSPITLTDSGRAVAEYIDKKAERAVAAGMDSGLTAEQRQAFYGTLAQINDNLQAYYAKLLAERK